MPSETQTIILQDDFNRPDSSDSLGDPTVGGPYNTVVGRWGIVNGEAYTSISAAWSRVYFSGASDFEFSFRNPNMGRVGVFFRGTQATSGWGLLFNHFSNTWEIWNMTSGSFSGWTGETFSPTNGSSDVVTIRAFGPDIFFYVNGVNKKYFYDHLRQTGTTFGYTFDSTTSGRIDDVLVLTMDAETFYGEVSGPSHVYKGHDRHSEDTGATP